MTRRSRTANPFALGMDLWMLGMDSAAVIGMRTAKLAVGDRAAHKESHQMVEEKLRAAAELPFVLATSGAASPHALTKVAVRHYSKKVRANRKRLSGKNAQA